MKGGRCRCPFIIHLLTRKGYDYAHSHRERHVLQPLQAGRNQALEALPGVSDVNVDLEKGEATWKESQPLDIAEVKKAINKLGFEA